MCQRKRKGGKHIVSNEINSHSGIVMSSMQQAKYGTRKLDGFDPCAAEKHVFILTLHQIVREARKNGHGKKV